MRGQGSGAGVRTKAVVVLVLVLSLPVGCGGMQPAEMETVDDAFWRAQSRAREPEVIKRRGGTLLRSELLAYLDQGPAFLLQNVGVEPAMQGGELIGFKVQSFFPRDKRFAVVDIVAGDIVTAVNGVRIVQPDDLFAVWTALREAPRLQVDVIRGTSLGTLTWEIVDDVAAVERDAGAGDGGVE